MYGSVPLLQVYCSFNGIHLALLRKAEADWRWSVLKAHTKASFLFAASLPYSSKHTDHTPNLCGCIIFNLIVFDNKTALRLRAYPKVSPQLQPTPPPTLSHPQPPALSQPLHYHITHTAPSDLTFSLTYPFPSHTPFLYPTYSCRYPFPPLRLTMCTTTPATPTCNTIYGEIYFAHS